MLGWKCEVNISELFHSKHTAEPENLRLTAVELDKDSQLVIQKNNSTTNWEALCGLSGAAELGDNLILATIFSLHK